MPQDIGQGKRDRISILSFPGLSTFLPWSTRSNRYDLLPCWPYERCSFSTFINRCRVLHARYQSKYRLGIACSFRVVLPQQISARSERSPAAIVRTIVRLFISFWYSVLTHKYSNLYCSIFSESGFFGTRHRLLTRPD